MPLIHATCIEIDRDGVLLRGPSGAGKSDLALRLIDGGARLVADDQVALEVEDGELLASAPPALRGLIEVRGFGLARLPAVARAVVRAVFDLVPGARPDRLPERKIGDVAGIALPCWTLDPDLPSAAARVRLAARSRWRAASDGEARR